MRWMALLVAALWAWAPMAAAQSERRVALVVGVGEYDEVADLTNPTADARRIHEALIATGFSLPEPLLNPTREQLEMALRDFSRSADGAAVAVLYFAGHGMQQFDDNWLIPRDARLERPDDIRIEGVRLQDIVGMMGRAQLRIIFLDACRNNPFSANWPSTMSPEEGLTRLNETTVPSGTVVAYSAGARQKAPDNGAYARALAEQMVLPGVELRTLLDRVRSRIAQGTTLTPDATIALNTAPFYFGGVGDTPSAQNREIDDDDRLWARVEYPVTEDMLRGYLAYFPEGRHREQAEAWLHAPTEPALVSGPPPPSGPCSSSSPVREGAVYFEWGRTNLNAAAMESVILFAQAVPRPRSVVIRAYTDTSLAPGFALDFTRREATTVRDALIAQGIDASVITAMAHGQLGLTRVTAQGVREPLNRRASIEICPG